MNQILEKLDRKFSLHKTNDVYSVFVNAPDEHTGLWLNAGLLISEDIYNDKKIINLIEVEKELRELPKEQRKALINTWLDKNIK